jgi:hypothetical protein
MVSPRFVDNVRAPQSLDPAELEELDQVFGAAA